jgi:hypothetical protein
MGFQSASARCGGDRHLRWLRDGRCRTIGARGGGPSTQLLPADLAQPASRTTPLRAASTGHGCRPAACRRLLAHPQLRVTPAAQRSSGPVTQAKGRSE